MPERNARRNNIGAIRLFLATAVLLSHCFLFPAGRLLDEPMARVADGMTIGDAAVDLFFVLSGYLITQSWFSAPNAGAFIVKRVSRIYPGYFVALVLSIAAAGIGCWPQSTRAFRSMLFVSGDNVLRTALFLDPEFVRQPRGDAHARQITNLVNGPMWTLQPELRCYGLVLALGMCGMLSRRWAPVIMTVAAAALFGFLTHEHGTRATIDFLSRFLAAFGVGIVVGVFGVERLPKGVWSIAIALAALLAVAWYWPLMFSVAFPILGGFLAFRTAFGRPVMAPDWFARNDYSYGVYLYGCPVQLLILDFSSVRDWWVLFACALPLTLILAAFSWHLVEAPCLRLTRRPVGHE